MIGRTANMVGQCLILDFLLGGGGISSIAYSGLD